MGAYRYAEPYFRELGITLEYIGRSEQACATGIEENYKQEQSELIADCFK